MPRNPALDRPAIPAMARNERLPRQLWRHFLRTVLDSDAPRGLSSHLLRDIGLDDRSTGDDGEEPWKRLR